MLLTVISKKKFTMLQAYCSVINLILQQWSEWFYNIQFYSFMDVILISGWLDKFYTCLFLSNNWRQYCHRIRFYNLDHLRSIQTSTPKTFDILFQPFNSCCYNLFRYLIFLLKHIQKIICRFVRKKRDMLLSLSTTIKMLYMM